MLPGSFGTFQLDPERIFQYTIPVEKIVRKFQSHRASQQSDVEYYRSLSPQQRIEILLDLIAQGTPDEAQQGFARVYRVTKLHGS
jgi:hypothetical protein